MSNLPQKQSITYVLEKNYMPYAMSVIISRAIPEIDGFKPSHRKLLYTMYKMGLLTGARTKSANVVGQTMKLNPHGDAAIYETLVRLTRGNDALLHPFVDSKGNFGKQYSRDMAYAAARYTEVKLDAICAEIFRDIDKDTVDFIDNYDGTMKEPTLLPTAFPNILVNPNMGIAVGMASSICSFNLKEVCDTAIALLKNPEHDIMKTLIAPDFSTGGHIIYDEGALKTIYESGRGSFKIRASYSYDKKNNCIEITEIPYTTTVEAIIDKIIELVKDGKVKEIADIRDETDLSGLKITIDLKRGADPDRLMLKLFLKTPLEDSFICNFNILINGTPVTMGIREILHEWTLFRIGCIKRSISYDIARRSEKLHLLEGLKKILLDIDRAIEIIRSTEEDALVVPNLMAGFEIDEQQAEFIAEIKLRNLNKEYILKRTEEIENLTEEIAKLKHTLENEDEIKKLIIGQLSEISKKYGKPRRTKILKAEQAEEFSEEEYIEDYNLKLFLTEQNYLKKISLVSLRASSEQKLKEDDFIIAEVETVNKADLLLFSNRCNVYKLKIHEIGDCKASSLGEYLPNILELEPDERIIGIVPTEDYSGYMLFGFENGKIAKIEMASYSTKLNRKKLSNAYSSSSPLCGLYHISEDCDFVAISSIGKALVFSTASISPKSTRSSQGVQVLNVRRKGKMSKICPLSEAGFENPDYYRTKNIPAAGYYLRDKDRFEKQLSLF